MPAPKLQKQLVGASAMVLEMAVLIILAALAGGWLDNKASTSPLMLLLCIGGALVVGMYRLIHTANRFNEDQPPKHRP